MSAAKVYAFKVELWTEYAASAALCSLRIATQLKLVGLRGLRRDDWLVLLALMIYTIEVSMAHVIVIITGGTNAGLTDAQREDLTLPANSAEYTARVLGSKAFLIGWLCYVGCVWTLKLCMASVFSRITMGLPRHKYMKFAVWYILGSGLMIVLVLFLNCRPLYHYWQINPNPGSHCTFKNGIPFTIGLVLNISSDLLLMSIPLPVILNAKIDLKRKIALTILFSAAAFVMLAGTLRVVFFFTSPQDATLPALWSCRETFVAFWVTNAPVMAPLGRRSFWKNRSSAKGSGYNNSQAIELGSQGASNSGINRRNFYQVDDDLEDKSDSTERIIDASMQKGGMTIQRQTEVDIVSEQKSLSGTEVDSEAAHAYGKSRMVYSVSCGPD